MNDPEAVAAALTHQHDQQWIQSLIDHLLDEATPATELRFAQDLLAINDTQTARILNVTRQAVAGWHQNGVPTERLGEIADLTATARLLNRKLRPERIPGAVRRSAPNLDGQTLLELAASEGPGAMYREVKDTFDLRRIAP